MKAGFKHWSDLVNQPSYVLHTAVYFMIHNFLKNQKMDEIWKNLHITITAYNILRKHILHVKGCGVDAVSKHWGQRMR
jgi:hypothetical protein